MSELSFCPHCGHATRFPWGNWVPTTITIRRAKGWDFRGIAFWCIEVSNQKQMSRKMSNFQGLDTWLFHMPQGMEVVYE
jgi:hypothetical protein